MIVPRRPRFRPDQLARAIALQGRGQTQARIAESLGVCRRTVIRALDRHNQRVAQLLREQHTAEKGRQIAVLEYLTEQAMEQWEQSTRDHVTTRATADAAGAIGETVTTTRTRTGDPRLLSETMKAMADTRRILGIPGPAADADEDPLIVAEMRHHQYNPDDNDI